MNQRMKILFKILLAAAVGAATATAAEPFKAPQFFDRGEAIGISIEAPGAVLSKTGRGDAYTLWSADGVRPTSLGEGDRLEVEVAEVGARSGGLQVMVQFFGEDGRAMGGFSSVGHIREPGALKLGVADAAAKAGKRGTVAALRMNFRLAGGQNASNYVAISRIQIGDTVVAGKPSAGAAGSDVEDGIDLGDSSFERSHFFSHSDAMDIALTKAGVKLTKANAGDAYTLWSAHGVRPTPFSDGDELIIEIPQVGERGAINVAAQFFDDSGAAISKFVEIENRFNGSGTIRIDDLKAFATGNGASDAAGVRLNIRMIGGPHSQNFVFIRRLKVGAVEVAGDPSVEISTTKANDEERQMSRQGKEMARIKASRDEAPIRVMPTTPRGIPVALPGEMIGFELRNQTGERVELRGSLKIEDYFGQSWEQPVDLQLEKDGRESVALSADLETMPLGHFTVTLQGTVDGTEFTSEAYFARMEKSDPEAAPGVENFIYAVCNNGGIHKKGRTERVLQALDMLGADMLRYDFYWESVHKGPGKFDFSRFDAIYDVLTAHDYLIMGLLAYTPRWAVSDELRKQPRVVWRSSPPPEEPWREYVKRTAERYPEVKIWEVWNEPDLTQFFIGTPEDYLEMLRSAYDIIKSIHPDGLVSTGGFALTSSHGLKKHPNLQKEVMKEGVDSYDVLAHHEHTSFRKFVENLDRLQAWREAAGSTQPVIFNETASGTPGPDQPVQLFKKHVYLRAWGAFGHAWFYFCGDRTWGLYTEDFEPRAIFSAYRNLVNHMGRKTLAETIDAGFGNFAYLFQDDKDSTIALWSEYSGAARQFVTVRLPEGAEAERVDLMGNRSAIPARSGLITVPIEEMPHLVTIRGGRVGELEVLEPIMKIAGPVRGFIGDEIDLDLRLTNPLEAPQTLTLKVSGDRLGSARTDTFELPAGSSTDTLFTLPLPMDENLGFGEILELEAQYELSPSGLGGTMQLPVALGSFVPADTAPDRRPDLLATTDRNIDQLFDYAPGQEHRLWSGPDDLSARAWLQLEDGTLRLTLSVSDDTHHQPETGKTIWKGDSVEWAIADAGAQNAWRFGIARSDGGATELALWNDSGPVALGEALKAEIERRDGHSIYRVSVPLTALRMTPDMLRDGIRTSFLVNDNDGYGRESVATPGGGLGSSFNPEELPMVRFE